MPITRITVRKAYQPEQVRAIMGTVQAALVDSLGIPPGDRQILFQELDPERFLVPPTATADRILLEITLFSGRTPATKRKLYQAVVANLVQCGLAATDVFIVLHESPQENWGLRGGVPACDLDLGFKVEV